MSVDLPPLPNFGTQPTTTTLQFDLGQEIGQGQGQNSVVFLATDRQLDTQLAVKRIPKSKLPPTYFEVNTSTWPCLSIGAERCNAFSMLDT